jgi:hypothetical protein
MEEKERKFVYPAVRINQVWLDRDHMILRMETWLRKKERGFLGIWKGKWYLQRFWSEYIITDGTDGIIASMSQFHATVYKSVICGRVDRKIVFPGIDGPARRLFEDDPEQIDERERIGDGLSGRKHGNK